MAKSARGRKTAVLFSVTCFSILLIVALATGEPRPPKPDAHEESLAAWEKVVTVLQHPRCLNCHQAEAPLQGDSRRPHIPHVVRGTDNHGVGAMRCGNCHNGLGNNETSRTPGAGGAGMDEWQLAPLSMLWQGLSSGAVCRSLKDPKHNGDRNGQEIIEHMTNEPLVLWGWNPGRGLEAVPMPHGEFVKWTKVWVDGGMACPR